MKILSQCHYLVNKYLFSFSFSLLYSSELYLKQASHDLAVFAGHAGRKTIEVNDVILLLRRQRAVTERKPYEYLVNTHLPLEYTQELLPCARAGKTVIPHAK